MSDGGGDASQAFTISGTVSGLTGTGLYRSRTDRETPRARREWRVRVQDAGRISGCDVPSVTVATGAVDADAEVHRRQWQRDGDGERDETSTVTCTASELTIGGLLCSSRLLGTGLVLQDNGGDNLTVSANGTFAFATPVASGAMYCWSTVLTQPPEPPQDVLGHDGRGHGRRRERDRRGWRVTCAASTYTIGGTIAGLAASDSAVLQDKAAADNLHGLGERRVPFTFATPVASGSPYAVTVVNFTQPASPSQICVVTAGGGNVTSANITSVVVTCTTTACAAQDDPAAASSPP